MTDQSIIPFGVYKGKKLANVPAFYLIWLYDNKKYNTELKIYIEDNLDVLRDEIKKEKQKSNSFYK